MDKYVLDGETYYYIKGNWTDSHYTIVGKNLEYRLNEMRLKSLNVKSTKVEDLIRTINSMKDSNSDKYVNILKEILQRTNDPAIIRKFLPGYVSVCRIRKKQQDAIKQFNLCRSKYEETIISSSLLVEVAKAYIDLGELDEAREISAKAKKTASGKYIEELKEINNRIDLLEEERIAKSKPERKTEEKNVPEKKNTQTLASWKGKSDSIVKMDYSRKDNEYIISRNSSNSENEKIHLSGEEISNIFARYFQHIGYTVIENKTVLCDYDDIKIVFSGIAYSINGIKEIFDIVCDKPKLYSITLTDHRTNEINWNPITINNLENNSHREVSLNVDTTNPIDMEFRFEIKGPNGFFKRTGMIYIYTDFNEPSVDIQTEDEEEIYTIDFRTFVIRSDYYSECRGHDVESVKAIIYIFDGYSTIEKEIPAYYCNDCNVFYIKESTFENLKKFGRILCPILSLEEYREMKKHPDGIGSTWAKKSVLKMYGYSASSADDLSDKTRRTILEYIIDSKVLTKQEVVDYLLFFIKYHQNSKKAVAKWESDIDYITGYKTDFTKKKVGIIYR